MLRNAIGQVRALAIICLALLYIINIFLAIGTISSITQLLLIIILFLSLAEIKGMPRWIGLILFATGIVILIKNDAPISVWMQGLTRNLYLLVMFSLVPLLSIPMTKGEYNLALENFLNRYLHNKSRFYLFISVLTFLAGIIINVATIPLLYQIGANCMARFGVETLSTAIIRGYSASMIWGPTYAAVALSTELAGTSWLSFFPYGFLMGSISLLIGWLLILKEEKNHPETSQEIAGFNQPTEIIGEYKKLYELLFFWILILGSIILTSWRFHINTINVVSLAALLFPPVWLWVIGKIKVLNTELKNYYFKQCLPRLSNEVVLFTAAGLLATAISYWDSSNYISDLIRIVTNGNSIIFFLISILLTSLTALMGIHPLATIAVLGGTVNPGLLDITAPELAMI